MTAYRKNSPAAFMPAEMPALRRRAFTLIEMMVVIFILGVLVTMIVGVSRYVMDESARKETEATQATVMAIVNSFYEEFDKYPPDRQDATDAPQGDEPGVESIVALMGCLDIGSNPGAAKAIYGDFAVKGDVFAYLYGINVPDADPRVSALRQRIKAITMDRLAALPEDATGVDDTNRPVFVDGWGNPMRYSLDGGLGDRPVLISCGSDQLFGWQDGTTSSEANKTDNIRSDGR